MVIQAKHCSTPLGTDAYRDWFIGHLKKELAAWVKPNSRRKEKGRLPDYLLMTTNVSLSGTEGGGIDEVDQGKRVPDSGLQGWQVWHRAKLSRLLDNAEDVRADTGADYSR